MIRLNCSNILSQTKKRCGKQFRVRHRAVKFCRSCYKEVYEYPRPLNRTPRIKEVYKKPKFEAIAPTDKGKRKK